MKKLVMLLMLGVSVSLLAQEKKGFELGFQLNEYHQDFGLGLNLTTPYLFKESIALRIRTNMMYLQHPNQMDFTDTWTPYYNVTLGVFGHRSFIQKNVALYGEGGVAGIIPSNDFSNEDFVFGGYGLFGFEFYFDPNFSYFFEAGGIGTDAAADKITGEPIYSNGFLLSVGFRITFNQTTNQ